MTIPKGDHYEKNIGNQEVKTHEGQIPWVSLDLMGHSLQVKLGDKCAQMAPDMKT